MTKISKVVLVLIFCASMCFFGVALLSFSSSWDVRARYEAVKKQKADRQQILQTLKAKTPTVQDLAAREAAARKFNDMDIAAMNRRADVIEKQLAELNKEQDTLSKLTVAKHEEIKAVREEVVRLRNEAVQLMAQLGTLRAERDAAVKEERRLKDLLVQAEGMLERAEQREQQLSEDGAVSTKQ